MPDEAFHHQNEEPPHLSQRGLVILIAVATMVGVSGFFMGLRQSSDFAEQTQVDSAIRAVSPHGQEGGQALDGEVPVAPRYSDLPATLTNPNRNWQASLTSLPTASKAPSNDIVSALSETERTRILQKRASRRAYDGAPPTVPHPIDQAASGSCLSCHGLDAEVVIKGRRPPVMSHQFLASCIQCHVPENGALETVAPEWSGPQVGASSFAGRQGGGAGSRAYAGAPPTIPHSSAMRENCMSCHGPDRPNALRTTHPERVSCNQCHASSAVLDQREVELADVQKPLKGLVPAPGKVPPPPAPPPPDSDPAPAKPNPAGTAVAPRPKPASKAKSDAAATAIPHPPAKSKPAQNPPARTPDADE